MTRLSRQFGVDREQLKKRIVELKAKNRNYDPAPEVSVASTFDFAKLLNREKEAVQLLLHAPDYLDTIIENISPEQFVEGSLKRLYQLIDQSYQNGDEISYEQLMLNTEESELKNVMVYLDDQWHQMQEAAGDEQYESIERRVQDVLEVYRGMELESGRRQKISELQQKQLNEQEELNALEDLLNQARQRQGL